MSIITTKLYGVTNLAPDGTDRQLIISNYLKTGQKLYLLPEPNLYRDCLAQIYITYWTSDSYPG